MGEEVMDSGRDDRDKAGLRRILLETVMICWCLLGPDYRPPRVSPRDISLFQLTIST